MWLFFALEGSDILALLMKVVVKALSESLWIIVTTSQQKNCT